MKIPPSLIFIGCWSALLLLTQCQHVNPQPPKAEGFDAPLSPVTSHLVGSITLPLSELQAKINKELDPVLIGQGVTKKGEKSKSFLPFSVIRSGPVQLRYVDHQVRVSAPLQVQLGRLFSTRDTMPDKKPFCAIQVSFSSPLTLAPTWRLSSRVRFVEYKWTVKPTVKLLGRTISLDKLAERIIKKNQTSIENAIDSVIYRDLRLDKLVAPIWRDVQKPLALNKQYGLWLLPKPVAVMVSPISGDSRRVTVPIRIDLLPETELNGQKPVHAPAPLPRLQKQNTLPAASDIRLMSFVSYAALNRVADRIVREKPIKLVMGSLTVKKVTVYGGQKSIIVKTDVSGLVDGTLYLRGRPEFDTTTNTLHFTHLDFDAQTQNVLSSFSSGLIHRGLRRMLEKLLMVPLGNEIGQLPQKIDDAFEKSGAGKKTDLDILSFRLIPQQIAIRPGGIQAMIRAESKVALAVQHL